ncbi:hypothetical protein [Aquimarina mytili]|uniref:Uncharacterized protein n=1 Tax=Aquimarina mytili TaxID=874423 RepID=A0A937A1Z1_9FLAO|nr:hypothetical protein [Aquimarina mytili]MBL0686138.1 hypothetical protein [Aquimarina mytili]
MNLIKTLILFIPFTIFCQTKKHIVDKVSNEICSELNKIENFDDITKSQAQNIMAKVFLANKTEWDNELDKIENSRNNGYNIFDNLLNHRLQLTCKKFKKVDNLIDSYLEKKPSKRKLYLKVKEFIISAELESNTNNLLSFFNESKRKADLTTKLKSLQSELLKHKKESGLYIMRSEYENNGSIFIINVFDYKTGNENVFIKMLFENEKDSFIDGLVFKNQTEIKLEKEKREKQNIDFVPPPPPPPPSKKKN